VTPFARVARVVSALGVAAVVTGPSIVLAAGKPGYPDKVVWRGVTWQVKTSRSAVGPGPCVFDKANVSVDANDNLHLRIAKNAKNAWTCAEIIAPTSYGYGTYAFTVESRVDSLDPNVVLGLFTWSDKAPYAHREIDIEFSRWATPSDPTNAQYVVQPYDAPNHLKRFTQPAVTTTEHRFTWQPGHVSWESYRADGSLIDSYDYQGADVPKPGDERVHLNLWLFNGAAPTNAQPVELVMSSFVYAP